MAAPRPVSCPLCGSPEGTRVWVAPASGKPAREAPAARYNISDTWMKNYGITIHYCVRCRFGWNDDREMVERIQGGYSRYEEQREYLYEEENRIKTALGIVSEIPFDERERKGKRLLDIGSSVGYFTKAAGLLGYAAAGIEPSRWAAEYGAKNLNVEIVNKSCFECDFKEDSFDVVLMVDVLEHASEYRSLLAKAYSWLKPGGHLLIVTPDIGSLAARLLGRRWWSLKPEHVVYFSKRSLTALLAELRYERIRVTSAGRRFSLPYWFFLATGRSAVLSDTFLRKVPVYLNFGDQMLCLASK